MTNVAHNDNTLATKFEVARRALWERATDKFASAHSAMDFVSWAINDEAGSETDWVEFGWVG